MLTELNIYKRFQRIVEKLGLDSRYSIKDLRNRCILDMVSSAAKEGKDVSVVADYVGLGDLRMQTVAKTANIIKTSPADMVSIRVMPYSGHGE